MIYLDYNATTPVAPVVREAMLPYLDEQYGNPSSTHSLGRRAAMAVEKARSQLAELWGCHEDEVVFTCGGTESNNLAIQGSLFRHTPPRQLRERPAHLVISAIEHPATSEPARFLESLGYAVTVVGCDDQGRIDPAAIAAALRPETVLVSVMHANNEVGTIEPIAEISRVCRDRGVRVHTDAAQSTGKLATRVDELGVDLLSIAGHKLYAPKGVGALYIRRGVELEPMLHGAGHEQGRRPGTENVACIAGLGEAAAYVERQRRELSEQVRTLRDRLQESLCRATTPTATVNAAGAERLPNTLSINFPRVNGAELLAAVEGLCASTGAACHSGASSLSATLRAMGLDEQTAQGTVRLSLGYGTTEADVDRAAALLGETWRRLVGD
ncbi:MAG: cysteine desulfurase [Planctomycetota bacterium]|nr:MAG: cysteine desulfurase [Planctomycetota bacterium]REJ92205.1 MAG: cysteine desulfurase [Planctomycetota bacterium]